MVCNKLINELIINHLTDKQYLNPKLVSKYVVYFKNSFDILKNYDNIYYYIAYKNSYKFNNHSINLFIDKEKYSYLAYLYLVLFIFEKCNLISKYLSYFKKISSPAIGLYAVELFVKHKLKKYKLLEINESLFSNKIKNNNNKLLQSNIFEYSIKYKNLTLLKYIIPKFNYHDLSILNKITNIFKYYDNDYINYENIFNYLLSLKNNSINYDIIINYLLAIKIKFINININRLNNKNLNKNQILKLYKI